MSDSFLADVDAFIERRHQSVAKARDFIKELHSQIRDEEAAISTFEKEIAAAEASKSAFAAALEGVTPEPEPHADDRPPEPTVPVGGSVELAPRKRPQVDFNQARDTAQSLRTFTRVEFAEKLNLSPGRAGEWLGHLFTKGIIRKGKPRKLPGQAGRPAETYSFVKPVDRITSPNGSTPKTKVPTALERDLVPPRRGLPVSGTGKHGKASTKNKEINKMLDRARQQGFEVKFKGDGHVLVVAPDGSGQKGISATPASDSTDKVKADLVNLGVKLDRNS